MTKMALGKSIKMYLTIFIATTCIYMVLYQYHISRQPMPSPEILKNKDVVDTMTTENEKQDDSILTSSAADLVRRYNLFVWSPLPLLATHRQKQQHPSSEQLKHKQDDLEQESHNFKPTETQTTEKVSSNESSNAIFQKQQSFLPKKQQNLPLESASSSSFSAFSLSLSLATSALSPNSSTSSFPLASMSPDSKSSKVSFDKLDGQHSGQQRIGVHRHYGDDIKKHAENDGAINGSVATSATMTTTTTTTIAAGRTVTKLKLFPKKLNASNSTLLIHSKPNGNGTTTKTTPATKRSKSSVSIIKESHAETSTPPLYIITPTYRRPEQLAELTRLGYTLKHITNLLWLVIEDANKTSQLVTQTLNRIGVPYEYLVAPMPEEYKKTKKAKPRGVSNRNRGLQWLRENATEGVFYFADDDNTYDIAIFEQMRYTTKVSMWPVGLVTKFGVSSPIIRNGKIEGFYDGWIGGRKYAVDMAGFAVSVKFLHDRPAAKMPFKPGYEEDGFLKSLAPLNNSEIELLASDCTEILTWHTQTKKNPPAERLNMTKYGNTNLVSIDKILVRP